MDRAGLEVPGTQVVMGTDAAEFLASRPDAKAADVLTVASACEARGHALIGSHPSIRNLLHLGPGPSP